MTNAAINTRRAASTAHVSAAAASPQLHAAHERPMRSRSATDGGRGRVVNAAGRAFEMNSGIHEATSAETSSGAGPAYTPRNEPDRARGTKNGNERVSSGVQRSPTALLPSA